MLQRDPSSGVPFVAQARFREGEDAGRLPQIEYRRKPKAWIATKLRNCGPIGGASVLWRAGSQRCPSPQA